MVAKEVEFMSTKLPKIKDIGCNHAANNSRDDDI
jgi:hypothetical protein